METVVGVIGLLCMLGFFIGFLGLIKPSIVRMSSRKTAVMWIAGAFGGLVLGGLLLPVPEQQETSAVKEATLESEQTAKKLHQVSPKDDADASSSLDKFMSFSELKRQILEENQPDSLEVKWTGRIVSSSPHLWGDGHDLRIDVDDDYKPDIELVFGEKMAVVAESYQSGSTINFEGIVDDIPSSLEDFPLEIENPTISDELLFPEIPDGLAKYSIEDIERLGRKLDVVLWNNKYKGMRWERSLFDDFAKQEYIHVDHVKAIRHYMDRRRGSMAFYVRELLRKNKALSADYYHPVRSSAYVGNYTVAASIVVDVCPKDNDGYEKALSVAEQLKSLASDFSDGFKIDSVKYHCSVTGTNDYADYGFLWKRGNEIEKMPKAGGLTAVAKPENTRNWAAPAWNKQEALVQ